jgi:hypothetical protein
LLVPLELLKSSPVIRLHLFNRDAAMSIYFFRSSGSGRTFAYSLGLTGRNIPPLPEHEKWFFIGVIAVEQIEAHPETLRQLRTVGYYVFKE